RPQWRTSDELTLNVFEIQHGSDVTARVAASDGASTTFRGRRDGQTLRFDGDGSARNVRVLLRSNRAARGLVNGKLVGEMPEGLAIEWLDPGKPLSLTLLE
ncbi:MAG TPA: hypothetical protein VLI90_12100, partial [Tepidisphaeraceae bacterium]|nr:hypothetical protein [Tepidisphaeraceae bacterium]